MNDKVDTGHLEALGVSRDNNKDSYQFDKPNPELLETFQSPCSNRAANMHGCAQMINMTCAEFTSLCPITGQPDFATIMIDYIPVALCVESKSLKLYLNGYRNHGEFHEACVNRIINDLVTALQPNWMRVIGFYTPRGGIPFHPTSFYQKKGVGFSLSEEALNRLPRTPADVPFAPV